MYYDKGDQFGCRGDVETFDYVEDFPVVIGASNQNACLVKYFVENKNRNSDLRITIF